MSANPSMGLFASFKILVTSLVAITHTRLDLLLTDFEEDRLRLLGILSQTLVGLFCLGVGLVLASILLVVAFWETHRLLVLGSLAAFFVASGLITLAFVIDKIRAKPKLFASSLAELLKDWQQLNGQEELNKKS